MKNIEKMLDGMKPGELRKVLSNLFFGSRTAHGANNNKREFTRANINEIPNEEIYSVLRELLNVHRILGFPIKSEYLQI